MDRMVELRCQGARDVAHFAPGQVLAVGLTGQTGEHRHTTDAPDDMNAVVSDVALPSVLADLDVAEALGRREQQLRRVFAAAPVGMATLDLDRRFVEVNPALGRLVGYEAAALVGRSIAELLDDDNDAADVLQRRAALRSVEGSATADKQLRRADGSIVWVEHCVGVVRDGSGIPAGFVSQFVDVTASRARHDRADEERTRLRATLDSLLDPHVVLEAVRDRSGVIVDFVYTDANEAACEYLGYERRNLVGARLLDVTKGHVPSGLFGVYVSTIERGEPLHFDDFAYRYGRYGDRRYDLRGTRVRDSLCLTWRDVTERYATASALAASEQRFRLLAENASDVVMHVRDATVVWVSPSISRATGWSPADWIDQHLHNFAHPGDHQALADMRTDVGSGRTIVARVRVRDSNGRYHWIENHASPFIDDDGRQDGAAVSWRIIDDQVAAEAELDRRARVDPLTGLANRAEALDRLAALRTRLRGSGRHLAVAFCDVDNFKTINDTQGHRAGDVVLRTLARRLTHALRPDDIVARVGGDELLVIIAGVHVIAEAETVAHKLLDVAREPILAPGGPLSSTLSIGVTLVFDDDTTETFLARADDAMYEAKRTGRDRVVVSRST